jgi:hypothetical protein
MVEESLRTVVDRPISARHKSNRPGNIRISHVADVFPILIEECATEPSSSMRGDYRPADPSGIQAIAALGGCEIGFAGIDRHALPAKYISGGNDFGLVGSDDEIEPVFRTLHGKFAADAVDAPVTTASCLKAHQGVGSRSSRSRFALNSSTPRSP